MSETSLSVFGEILWDLLPSGPVLGGAPFNFAYRMQTLGVNSTIFSRVGADDLGRKALDQALEMGMETSCIETDAAYPTGSVDVWLDENKSPDFKIYPDVAFDHIRLTSKMVQKIKKAQCFYFGTVAQRSAVSRRTLTQLLELFKGKPIFLDINLRKGCYDLDIVSSSIAQATILKMNEQEVAVIAEALHIQYKTLGGFLDQIIEKTNLKYSVITLGEKGACAISDQDENIQVCSRKIHPLDTCGSGDGFSAGFLFSLLENKSLEYACRFGNALGALVALQKGATGRVDKNEIEHFMN